MPEAVPAAPDVSATAQVFPILVGYACVSVFLLLTALVADISERVNSWRMYKVLRRAASRWRSSNEVGAHIQDPGVWKLLQKTFPLRHYSQNEEANSFLNEVLRDLKRAAKRRPESFWWRTSLDEPRT